MIAILFLLPMVQTNYCGKMYRNVRIDCEPRDHKYMAQKYWWDEATIERKCRDYIDRTPHTREQSVYCNVQDPSWCIDGPMFIYNCHQMSGGMLTIDGAAQLDVPPNFVYRRKRKL